MHQILTFLLLLIPLTSLAEINPNPVDMHHWQNKYRKLDFTSEKSLQKNIKKQGPLSSYLKLQLGQQHLDNKQYSEAIKTLASIDSSLLNFWKSTLLSQAYLAQNQSGLGLKSLRQIPNEPTITNNPEKSFYRQLYHDALKTKAELHQQRGRKATVIYKKLWSLFPDFEPYQNQTQFKGSQASDKLTRIHIMYQKGLFKDIPQTISLNEITKAKVDACTKSQGFNELGGALRRAKDAKQALVSYTQATKTNCRDKKIMTRALYWKASLERSLKKTRSAIKTYKTLIKKFPRHRYADDAYYALWKIYKKQKQQSKERWAYSRLMKMEQGDLKERVLWNKAYTNFKKKKYPRALAYLDRLLKSKSLGDESHPRALYWKAKILLRQKKKKSAKAIYQQLIENYPFSFYSVIAADKLKTPIHYPKPQPLAITLTDSPLALELNQHIQLLTSLGLQTQAQQLLDYFNGLAAETARASQLNMMIHWHASHGYYQAMKLAAKQMDTGLFKVDLEKNNPLVWYLYPLAYQHDSQKPYRQTGLPRGAIEAIMREESQFRQRVISPAGARGVMQLMPKTARYQAKKIELAPFKINDLFTPQTNITLGSSYFVKMLGQFDNHYALAVMAYNAGPGNVRKWLKKRRRLPLDQFIEEIPFSETRGYVKRVIRSMRIYGHLLGEKKFTRRFVKMKLPAK